MKTVLMLGGLLCVGVAWANVGVFSGSGQTPIVEKTDAIQMVEEVVVMTPRAADGPMGTSCNNQDTMDAKSVRAQAWRRDLACLCCSAHSDGTVRCGSAGAWT